MSHVAGDKKRIFVNPALGCPSECSYCYLPLKGIPVGERISNPRNSEQIIDAVLSSGIYVPKKAGSVISIGCFTECWDSSTKDITIELIKYFLGKGNFVQFATKRYVDPKDIESLLKYVQERGQLTIFISCATISYWKIYEKGTTNPAARLSSLRLLEKIGIPTYLYVKPVINNVTIEDVDEFSEYIKMCSGAVVGSMFVESTETDWMTPLPVGGLDVLQVDDEIEIKSKFSAYGQVFSQSIQAVDFWRGQ
jgi:DNA repair photolyase